MKIFQKLVWLLAGLALPVLGFAQVAVAPAASPDLSAFTNDVPVSALRKGIDRSLGLRVTRVLSDRPEMEPGGRYLIEGVFRLRPTQSIRLLAAQRLSFGMPIVPDQTILLPGGQGRFRLIGKMDTDGALNVFLFSPDLNLTSKDQFQSSLVGRVELSDGH